MLKKQHLITALFLFSSTLGISQMKVREELPEKYKWALTNIYASDDAWQAEKNKIQQDIQQLNQYKGKLTQSPKVLLEALDLNTKLMKTMYRLYSYASMSSDQDTRVSKYQSMKQELMQIFSQYGAITSYMQPELLTLKESQINDFIKKENKLEPYRFYLTDLLKQAEHTGTEDVERVMAYASLMSGNASNVNSIFTNAEFPYTTITVNGKEEILNPSNLSMFRSSNDRSLRKEAFEKYFGKLHEFQRTFGALLYGNLNSALFNTKARNYNNSLEAALKPNNIPTEVYKNLVKNINDNLGTFHRYLSLRKRMMGVDTLHYYDLYAPLLKEVDLTYTVDEAIKNIMASLKILGPEYVKISEKAFNERWIDMYPNEGKRNGAYANGSAYDVHPYILMNYNGQYNDMATLTHELGHAMHSYFSNKNQHFINSNYTIFVAEVASTFNEALLNDYILKQIKDDETRLAILGNFLEGAKGTLFRQTQFAEFEAIVHEKVGNGEALTGADFDKIYLDITKKYYGHDKNICVVDDYIKSEWSYIPHFYNPFYVYQYATSFTASTALAEKALKGQSKDIERYLTFLSSGSTKYPIDLLKDAGVDMNSTEPFDLTIAKINEVMDEMETILNRLGR